mgnify:CR=1 FL=1
MKLLLDENFPQKVSLDFPEHTLMTVEKAGWKGKRNGELLELIIKEGFDGLITLDQNLPKQQNLSKYTVKSLSSSLKTTVLQVFNPSWESCALR